MTVIAITAARVEAIYPTKAIILPAIAAVPITKGQVIGFNSSGDALIADANVADAQQARGIALQAAGIGGGFAFLKEGAIAGFDLSGITPDAPVFLSDTAGALDTAVGTLTVPVGISWAMTDEGLRTEVLWADFRWGPDFA